MERMTTTPTTARPSSRLAGLSNKQFNRINTKLATVDDAENDENDYQPFQDYSFQPEPSFLRAPLNSRVPQLSPHSYDSIRKSSAFKGVALDIQQAAILEDFQYVLVGIQGQYITYHPDYAYDDMNQRLKGSHFIVDPSIDKSLATLIHRILPLASLYTSITAFVEQRSAMDWGLVNHALCAAIRDMLKEYHLLLAQLETLFYTSPCYTLQMAFYHLQPALHKLTLVHQLALQLIKTETPDIGDEGGDEAEEDSEDMMGETMKKAIAQINAEAKETALESEGIAKGGEVIKVVWEKLMKSSGDPVAHEVYTRLLFHASQPYAEMLLSWTTSGDLTDPYDELLVREAKSISKKGLDMDYTDEYWEKRYTLRDGSSVEKPYKPDTAFDADGTLKRFAGGACIPPFLEAWKFKILFAGKYLNVIRECGIEVSKHRNYGELEKTSINSPAFYKQVEDAYTHANRALLKLLLEDEGLVSRLRSLKHYFFLADSDFFVHFLDQSYNELRKPAKNANLVKLQSLLDLTLRNPASPSFNDPYKEDVKVTMSREPLYQWLLTVVNVSGALGQEENLNQQRKNGEEKPIRAIEGLSFDYTVSFPLSLVISRKTILRYQLIFRFLLHLKYTESALVGMWSEHTQDCWRRNLKYKPFDMWRTRVCVLRARMLELVRQVTGYVCEEVLHIKSLELEEKISKVQTVDALLKDHVDFLDGCLKECMLTNARLIERLQNIMKTIGTFTLYSVQLTKTAMEAMDAIQGARKSGIEPSETMVPLTKIWNELNKFEHAFNKQSKVRSDASIVDSANNSSDYARLTRVLRFVGESIFVGIAGKASWQSMRLTLHLLLDTRVTLPVSSKARVNKWFNIQTTDSGSGLFRSELSTWKNLCTATAHQVPPMVVEFILDSSDVPPNQACLFVDGNSKRNTVQSSVVLERWTLQLSGAGVQEDLPVVYKRCIVLFRALYTLLRILPLYSFIRRLRRSHARGLNIGVRLSAEKSSGSGDVLNLETPLSQDTPSNAIDAHRFTPINTPAGNLNLSVEYRRNTNFIVDDIESLLSSAFVDEDYYTPTLTKHRSTPSASEEKSSEQQHTESSAVVRDYVARAGASRVRTNSTLSNQSNERFSPRTHSYSSSSPSVRPMSVWSGASPTPSLTGVATLSYQQRAGMAGAAGAAISIPENQDTNQSSDSSANRRYSSSFGYRRNSSIGGGGSSGESLIRPLASPSQPSPPSVNYSGVQRKLSTKLSTSLAEEGAEGTEGAEGALDDDDIGNFIKLLDEKPQLKASQGSSPRTISKQELDERLRMMSMSSLAGSANSSNLLNKDEESKDFGEVVGQMDFDELDVRRSMSAPIATSSSRVNVGLNAALTTATSPEDKSPLYYDVGASRGRSSSRRDREREREREGHRESPARI
ncbi:hypothetical protein E3P99_02626 [Wallemia hederae]|uniref:Autophagy-related protein 13 n=1 Tax=Wallemia hederae TaxID=1540922 RepID=A0A4T0FJK0_9BASI|nr:hypothetical protein E3P99_02626 [Wallemia hederae]